MTKKTTNEQIINAQVGLGVDVRSLIRRKKLPYKTIVDLNKGQRGYPLSTATISRLCTGKLTPTWEALQQLLRVLGEPEQRIELHWKPKYEAILRLIEGAEIAERGAALIAQSVVGGTCPVCYAWAIDLARHQEWHDASGAQQPDAPPVRQSARGRLRSVPTGPRSVPNAG